MSKVGKRAKDLGPLTGEERADLVRLAARSDAEIDTADAPELCGGNGARR